MIEYVWAIGSDIDPDATIDESQYDVWVDLAKEWLSDNPSEGISLEVRLAREGEVQAIYEVQGSNLQILTYEPEEIRHLTDRVFEAAWQEYQRLSGACATSLDQLLAAMLDESPYAWVPYSFKHGERDWEDLPTFGGKEPSDTTEVWSWDESRLLVGTCTENLRIEPREPAGADGGAL